MPKSKKSDLGFITEIEKKSYRIKSVIEEVERQTGMARSGLKKMEVGLRKMEVEAGLALAKIRKMRGNDRIGGFDFEEMMMHINMASIGFEETGRNAGLVRSQTDELKKKTDTERSRFGELAEIVGLMRSRFGEVIKDADKVRSEFEGIEAEVTLLRFDYAESGIKYMKMAGWIDKARSIFMKIVEEVDMMQSMLEESGKTPHKITKKPTHFGTIEYDLEGIERGADKVRSEFEKLKKKVALIGAGFEGMERDAGTVGSDFGHMGAHAGRMRSDLLNRLEKHKEPRAGEGIGRQGSDPPYDLQPENLRVVIRDTDIAFKINPKGHLDPTRRRILALADEIRAGLKKMEAEGASRSEREDFVIAKNREILEAALVDFNYDAYEGNPHLPPAVFQLIAWGLKSFLVNRDGAAGTRSP